MADIRHDDIMGLSGNVYWDGRIEDLRSVVFDDGAVHGDNVGAGIGMEGRHRIVSRKSRTRNPGRSSALRQGMDVCASCKSE